MNEKTEYLKVLNDLLNYNPKSIQEETDKQQMIWLLNTYKEKAFDRDLMFGHFTSSAIVVDKTRKYVLMAYHNIYNSWAWLGGHADSEYNLEALARREVHEETSLDGIRLLENNISSIEILTVERHIKKGKFVPSHLHYNVTYLYEGDMERSIKLKEDENSGVKWIKIDDLYEHVYTDHGMYDIYMKSLERFVGRK